MRGGTRDRRRRRFRPAAVFAKAINAGRNPRSPGLYRREIEVMASLPESVPAPRLRFSYDDGDWVMLVLDDVEGTMPTQPWEPGQFARVLTALEQLSQTLTPAPIAAMSIVDDLAENFRSWHTIAADPALTGRLDAWAKTTLPRLVELESGWAAAAAGETLCHADLRADNLLLTADGGVMVVDWPYAVTGAPWVDALLFLPSVAATSSIDPEQAWAGFTPARDADPDAVNAVLAAVAGDFLYQSMLPGAGEPADAAGPPAREGRRGLGVATQPDQLSAAQSRSPASPASPSLIRSQSRLTPGNRRGTSSRIWSRRRLAAWRRAVGAGWLW
jgi:hypothetical protein